MPELKTKETRASVDASFARIKDHSGRELEWFQIGFAPRKQDLTLYGLLGGSESLLARLGKHGRGKGCLYLKRLADVDTAVLRRLMERAARPAPP